ncbi:hypothetical protein PRZ48_013723 [Zasmidium cellare]|uniref:Uncharacterized protein n=1 Tax=Zasmidium cellare TaxID=395010 RepID=A0ABR0E1V7_ZASCE|nr:hypothetical protein PRZ48_013723 [Zasmidium cellare]
MNATEQAIALCETVKDNFGDLIAGLNDIQCDALPSHLMEYLKDNPGTTAMELALLLVTFLPGVIATPALLALGFGPLGPMADQRLGWLAATVQSIVGTPLPFRVLQSAAIGGWALAVVNWVIQGAIVVSGGVMEMLTWRGGNKTEV